MARTPTALDAGIGRVQSDAAITPMQSTAVPQGAFGETNMLNAISGVTESFANFAGKLAESEQRVQTRQDAIARARAFNLFSENMRKEYERWQTEEDIGTPESLGNFTGFADQQIANTLENHVGSKDSMARLTLQLEEARGTYVTGASEAVSGEQLRVVNEQIGDRFGTITAKVAQDPTKFEEAFRDLDAVIDDYAGALTEAEEAMFTDRGRQQIVMSTIDGFINRGAFQEAKDIFNEHPSVMALMSPEQQRSFVQTVNTGLAAENEARNAGLRRRQELAAFLGREPTMAELVRSEGLAAPKGKQTLAELIAQDEEVLGRPLTEPEKLRRIGLSGDAPKPLTDAGKLVHDEAMIVETYGENSPQLAAFREAVADGPDAEVDLSDVSGVRKEFTKLSGVYISVRDAHKRIKASVKEPSAAGDLALIFNFMKMLDPGSVVREGEFATAQNAAGVPERVRNLFNRLMSGERLSEAQRGDFVNQAENIMHEAQVSQTDLENQYRGIAERNGMNPEDVIVDFVNTGSAEKDAVTVSNAGETPEGKKRLQLNLKGDVVGGGEDLPRPKTIEEAMKLPPGTEFIAPDGRKGTVRGKKADAGDGAANLKRGVVIP